MNAPHVVAVRCHWCQKQRAEFLVHRLTSGQVICENCLDWHLHAIEFLGGTAAPRGCQGCGRGWQEISDFTPGVEVRMYVVVKDGIYQLHCKGCADVYLPKRKEMFAGTQFGNDVLSKL